MSGKLYLIPVTIGNEEYKQVLPEYVIETAKRLRFFVVEELRSARRFLRMIDRSFPIDQTVFFVLNEHTKPSEISGFLKPSLEGNDMGLMSEAGLPGIADPGAILVKAAHERNIKVIPMTGPSSIILGLIASGLSGQTFVFHGYLPVRPAERDARLKELERRAYKGETQIFMETPYRAQRMIEAIISMCQPDLRICIAADITLPAEEIMTMKVSEWRKKPPSIDGRLVIFILGV